MDGALAILAAMICFIVPLAVPLFAQRWRTFLIMLTVGAVVAFWLNAEMPVIGSIPNILGTFLGGLILIGFAFGAIARFVMLVGKRPDTPAS